MPIVLTKLVLTGGGQHSPPCLYLYALVYDAENASPVLSLDISSVCILGPYLGARKNCSLHIGKIVDVQLIY